MPRKPTEVARKAREGLLELIAGTPREAALPPMRELGERFDMHPSTMFRMLRDLAEEGAVWQSPGGRFFPMRAREEALKGAPICFIGRELWRWSQLYQELLEGISEVCAAAGSPLVQFSAPSLVRQAGPDQAPQFASPERQVQEMSALLNAVPRGAGGFILDHLWGDEALSQAGFPGGQRIQLLAGSGRHAQVIQPDYAAGARLVRERIVARGFREIILVRPFEGDPAVDASVNALREELAGDPRVQEGAFPNLNFPYGNWVCLLCPEDNIANAVQERAGDAEVISTQGTGRAETTRPHLSYDFRQLGRDVASTILLGKAAVAVEPVWG